MPKQNLHNAVTEQVSTLNSTTISHGKDIDDLKKGHRTIESYMIGVAIVSVVGFVTMLISVCTMVIDADQYKAESYQSLQNRIDKDLSQAQTENFNIQISNIQQEIQDLKKKNPYLK